MNADDLEIGAIYHVGAGCGVPHTFRPITFLLTAVLHPADSYRYDGMDWLSGAEFNKHASGDRRWIVREIYVITAGIRPLYSPRREAHRRRELADRTARALHLLQANGPVIPRQRTPSDTSIRSNR